MTLRVACTVVVMLALLAVSSARAQPPIGSSVEPAAAVEDARSMFLNGGFVEAITAYESVLGDSELTTEIALECHRYLVVLYDLTADHERAEAHAAAAAALDRTVSAPEGASADAEELLRRAAAAQEPARVVVAPVGSTREHTALRVRAHLVNGEVLGLASLRLRCSFAGHDVEARGALEGTELLRENAESPVRCEAAALSPQGAALVRGQLSLQLRPPLLAPSRPGADRAPESPSRRPLILGVSIGAGVLAVASVLLVAAFTRSPSPTLGSFEPTFANAASP